MRNMWYRTVIIVSMLLAAFLITPYTFFLVYPFIALVAYLFFRLLLAGFNRLFPRLDTPKGSLVCLVVFLLILFGQFLHFNSRAHLARVYLGDLAKKAKIIDHHVLYTYDPSFSFLIDNSNELLDELLRLKEFGAPETSSSVIFHVPQRLVEPFRGVPFTKYKYIDENGTVFIIAVSADKKFVLYRIIHT